jgi:pimeloyl-ACP methyl ester carboxylesterase
VGDCRSLVIHPASTTHFRMSDEALAGAGIGQGTIRLSIGLEDADDLIDDLKRALKAAEKRGPDHAHSSQRRRHLLLHRRQAFDAAKPTVVFIHGVLNDHSVWILQSRYLANHGWNVLAVDLPGHCRSGGDAPGQRRARRRLHRRAARRRRRAARALVGHSWGSLIALEAAARWERVSHLVLVGTAYPDEGVARAHRGLAERAREGAAHGQRVLAQHAGAPPSALGPGTWVYGAGMALGRKVLRSNPQVNLFHRGFVACDSYANGEQAMAQVTCPVLFPAGAQDQMTPPKAAQGLIAKAGRKTRGPEPCRWSTRQSFPARGPHQMTEAPEPGVPPRRGTLAGRPTRWASGRARRTRQMPLSVRSMVRINDSAVTSRKAKPNMPTRLALAENWLR